MKKNILLLSLLLVSTGLYSGTGRKKKGDSVVSRAKRIIFERACKSKKNNNNKLNNKKLKKSKHVESIRRKEKLADIILKMREEAKKKNIKK